MFGLIQVVLEEVELNEVASKSLSDHTARHIEQEKQVRDSAR